VATWGDIERELLKTRQPNGQIDFDGVRRRYLAQLAAYTKRSVIVYETQGFAPPQSASPADVSITLDPDMGAFMEVVHGLPKDDPIDLIIDSPGGTAEAAEAITEYLRGRFPGLRVIVPVAAMSAATMMAMAADEIVMAAHSQLGPIDPQLTIATPEGPRFAPAEAIREQFEQAKKDLAAHPEHTAAWLPILRSYAPALLQICADAASLSKRIVTEWLARYMLSGEPDPAAAAAVVAERLSDYQTFKSHARRLDRDFLRSLGLKIVDLEADQQLQDLVLSIHHSIDHLQNHTGCVKLVENHMGKAFMRRVGGGVLQIQVPGPPGPGPGGTPVPVPGAQPPQLPGNRQQRRQAERDQKKR
jgi:hypothetical protein